MSLSKRQKLSDPQLEDLPDEVILEILGYLDSKGVIYCGHLSRRIRTISQDESLWQKINLCWQTIPIGFLQMVLNNGCKYLNLAHASIHGSLTLKSLSKLAYLDLTNNRHVVRQYDNGESFRKIHLIQKNSEELLGSCQSLQKLSLNYLRFFSEEQRDNRMKSIFEKNGKSLEVLNIAKSWDLEALKLEVNSCIELKELNLVKKDLTEDAINFLVNNLTPKIEKLSLSSIGQTSFSVTDEQIKTLVERCKKITSLDLEAGRTRNPAITDNSITSIIKNLQHSLEELDVSFCENISYTKLLELKFMPKLKVLNCHGRWSREMERNLGKQMPHLIVNPLRSLEIAENISFLTGLWDIKVKRFCQLNVADKLDISKSSLFQDDEDELLRDVPFAEAEEATQIEEDESSG